MRVKIGQLKTHLSSYVKSLQAGGEPIEVCVREDTVAYLTASTATSDQVGHRELAADLQRSGLTVSQWGRSRKPVKTGTAKGASKSENSVLKMREEKGW